MFEIMENINKTKSELINTLQNEEFNDLLAILLDRLIVSNDFAKEREYISSQMNKHSADFINTMLSDLVRLYGELGTSMTI
jgi:hypothetical protein